MSLKDIFGKNKSTEADMRKEEEEILRAVGETLQKQFPGSKIELRRVTVEEKVEKIPKKPEQEEKCDRNCEECKRDRVESSDIAKAAKKEVGRFILQKALETMENGGNEEDAGDIIAGTREFTANVLTIMKIALMKGKGTDEIRDYLRESLDRLENVEC